MYAAENIFRYSVAEQLADHLLFTLVASVFTYILFPCLIPAMGAKLLDSLMLSQVEMFKPSPGIYSTFMPFTDLVS